MDSYFASTQSSSTAYLSLFCSVLLPEPVQSTIGITLQASW
jgi:hypothetical protein